MSRLRERYTTAGLTRKQFAEGCGCSEAYIYGVEAGGDASGMTRRTVSGEHGKYEYKPFKNEAQAKEMKAIWLEHFAGLWDE